MRQRQLLLRNGCRLSISRPGQLLLGSALAEIHEGSFNSSGRTLAKQCHRRCNTYIDADSNGAPEITNATAIGAKAVVTQSNSLLLGSNTSVGIGTSAPKTKLHVQGGDVYVPTQGNGIILTATNGAKCFRVTVNNAGAINTTAVTCP